MSLPPNMKLSRQNSKHVPINSGNSNANTNQTFPWKTIDKSPSDDRDDRLSTISSKEESHGSEKRKNASIKKTDSQSQTENDLFEKYVADIKDNKSSTSLRRRNVKNMGTSRELEPLNRSGSDSSINSDEIFLSLPVNGRGDKKNVYRASPGDSDRSIVVDTDSTMDHIHSLSSSPYNCDVHPSCVVMATHNQLHPSHIQQQFPNNRSVFTASPVALQQPHIKAPHGCSTYSEPTFIQQPIPNFQISSIPPPFNQANIQAPQQTEPFVSYNQFPNAKYNLRQDESGLYSRRQGNNNHDDAVELSHRSQQPHKNIIKPHVQPSNGQNVYFNNPNNLGKNLIDDHSPSCGSVRGQDYNDVTNYHSGDSDSGFRSLPHFQHLPSNSSGGSNRVGNNLAMHRRTSSLSSEETAQLGLNQLDEEEVSMMSFHNYLKNHGVDLDMSNVQSSDV